jgi:citrate synthase
MGLVDTSAWVTEIAEVQQDDVVIRGERLTKLIGEVSFAEMAFLIFTGRRPSAGEGRVLEALLVSVMEHGISPSSMVSRLMASYGVPIQVGIASGALTMGDFHGGSGEAAARAYGEAIRELGSRDIDAADLDACAEHFVRTHRDAGRPVDGFGHPQHDSDPRARLLLDLAEAEGVKGIHCVLLEKIEVALARSVGRAIPANLDGVSAALLLDLGLDWRLARPLMIAARSVGLAAHFVEELDQQNRWRHVPSSQVTYTGPQPDD